MPEAVCEEASILQRARDADRRESCLHRAYTRHILGVIRNSEAALDTLCQAFAPYSFVTALKHVSRKYAYKPSGIGLTCDIKGSQLVPARMWMAVNQYGSLPPLEVGSCGLLRPSIGKVLCSHVVLPARVKVLLL